MATEWVIPGSFPGRGTSFSLVRIIHTGSETDSALVKWVKGKVVPELT
jgi:hypothetical protein